MDYLHSYDHQGSHTQFQANCVVVKCPLTWAIAI